MELLSLFSYPFMQRALVGGMIVGAVFGVLGVYTVLRKMSFFGDGIAHASLAGIAIGLLLAVNPLSTAILFSVIIAALMFVFEKKSRLASDAVIGILFTFSMALGILLMSFHRGYQPDLLSYLFGNILTIQTSELWVLAAAAIVILALVLRFRKILLFFTLDPDGAHVSGVPTNLVHFLFHIILAVAVVLAVKIVGIILVAALLVLPASTAKLIARSFSSLIWNSFVLAELMVIGGLIASAIWDVPSGAMIILVGFSIFLCVLLTRIRPKRARKGRIQNGPFRSDPKGG
ncbi:MAG: metal ABC transporter permease [Candidatus Kerfeldbacteria bacterium]|nr:metal ABC transporter permease [Candidatus Kerfeldbacteria bacterium]